MRYVGGKARIAKWVAGYIEQMRGSAVRYVEPFVGGGAVFTVVAPTFEQAECGDAHEDLALLWQAVADGWEPLEYVSREQYEAARTAEPSAWRGFVGYGSSWGNKWFGGYIDRHVDVAGGRNYLAPSRAGTTSRSLIKSAPAFKGRPIHHRDYRDWGIGAGDLVYCDPPYVGTLGYPAAGEKFNTVEFWSVADRWVACGATVIVSEAFAPDTWVPLAERERKAMLRVAKGGANQVRPERLYVKQ